MAFRFTLAPVLKLRESIEERDLHLLERTQYEIAHAVQLLETMKNQVRAELVTRDRELAAGSAAAHLCVVEEAKQRLREHQQSLEGSLAKLQLRREQQLASYEAARRNRQVLSELCDRQREAHEVKAERARQQVVDEMFLVRHRKK